MMGLVLTRAEVFTGDVTGSHNVSDINKWIDETQRPPTMSAMHHDNVLDMLNKHDWEEGDETRIEEIMRAFLHTEPWARRPLILIQDGMHGDMPSTFVIDGWHRFAMYYFLQKQHDLIKFPTWIFKPEELAQFKLELPCKSKS